MKYWKIAALLLAIFGVGVVSLVAVTHPSVVARRAVGASKCEPVTVDVDFGPQYQGTLVDTHIHMPDDQMAWLFPIGDSLTVSDYACMFEREGTPWVFAWYPIYSGFTRQQVAVAKKAQEEFPGLIVPFIMPPDNDGSPKGFPTVTAEKLSAMLNVAPAGLFKGYGEIGLYERGDHGGPKGAPALPPDSSRLQEIYPVVRQHNLLVYFHLGEGQQGAFEQVLAANRDINFIWHGDQLIKGSGKEQDFAVIDGILSRHPNAYYGIDELYGDTWLLKPEGGKEAFLAHFENYDELLDQDVATWKAFIERHPNQVLWGTDRGWFGGWALDPEVGFYLTRYARAFIHRLDPAVQENFAYKNAERLISGL